MTNDELRKCRELNEVAFLMWLIQGTNTFKLPNFTLGQLEDGLKTPRESAVLAGIHAVMLMPLEDVQQLGREKFGSDRGALRPEKTFSWWTTKLVERVREWIRLRRALAHDLRIKEEDEEGYFDDEDIDWFKSNIAELDDLLRPLLKVDNVGEMEPEKFEEDEEEEEGKEEQQQEQANDKEENGEQVEMEEDDRPYESTRARNMRLKREKEEARQKAREEKESLEIEKLMPIKCTEDYEFLSSKERLLFLQSLLEWRASGYPDPSVYEALRALEAESLREDPLAEDADGNRYYYFPQFYRECRIYREVPVDLKQAAEKENNEREEKERAERERRAAEKAAKDREREAAREAKRKQEELKLKRMEEERLSMELIKKEMGGGRRSSRQRVQPTRFEAVASRREVGRKDSDASQKNKPQSRSRARGKRGQKKMKRECSGDDDEASFDFRDPEPYPLEWDLIVNDLESLKALLLDKRKERNKANRALISHLNTTVEYMEDQAAALAKEAARMEKLDKLRNMPRKRSGRQAALDNLRVKKEQEEKEAAERQAEREAILEQRRKERREKMRLKKEQELRQQQQAAEALRLEQEELMRQQQEELMRQQQEAERAEALRQKQELGMVQNETQAVHPEKSHKPLPVSNPSTILGGQSLYPYGFVPNFSAPQGVGLVPNSYGVPVQANVAPSMVGLYHYQQQQQKQQQQQQQPQQQQPQQQQPQQQQPQQHQPQQHHHQQQALPPQSQPSVTPAMQQQASQLK